MRQSTRLCIFIITLTLLFPAIDAQTILFDSTSGFFGLDSDIDSGFLFLKFELEKNGFSVRDVIDLKGNSIQLSMADLKKTSVLVIVNPIREYEFYEIETLMKFVNNGGKLLIICDNPRYVQNANRIAGVFGGRFLKLYISEAYIPDDNSTLYSVMPVEVEDANLTINVTAKAREWTDVFELGGEEIYKNYTIFATKKIGKGIVAFLGDKDFMNNKNLYTGNVNFAIFVFSMPVKPETAKPKLGLSFNIKRIEVNVTDKPVVVSVIARDRASNQSVEVLVPTYLQGVIVPFETKFNITSGETKILRFMIYPDSVYREIRDYVIFRETYGEWQQEQYLPVRVVWG